MKLKIPIVDIVVITNRKTSYRNGILQNLRNLMQLQLTFQTTT